MTIHLVISDIHQESKTLRLLLEKYQGQFYDIWCLGDIVGHGEHLNGSGNSAECYQILLEYQSRNRLCCVKGNWEYWATLPPTPFTEGQSRLAGQIMDAYHILDNQDLMKWISTWEWIIEKEDFTLTHGWTEKLNFQNMAEPWESYLTERDTSQITHAFLLDRIRTRHVIVGHTHEPGFFRFNGRQTKWYGLTPDMLDKDQDYSRGEFRFVLNPGALSGARAKEYSGLRTALLINTEDKSFRFIST